MATPYDHARYVRYRGAYWRIVGAHSESRRVTLVDLVDLQDTSLGCSASETNVRPAEKHQADACRHWEQRRDDGYPMPILKNLLK